MQESVRRHVRRCDRHGRMQPIFAHRCDIQPEHAGQGALLDGIEVFGA